MEIKINTEQQKLSLSLSGTSPPPRLLSLSRHIGYVTLRSTSRAFLSLPLQLTQLILQCDLVYTPSLIVSPRLPTDVASKYCYRCLACLSTPSPKRIFNLLPMCLTLVLSSRQYSHGRGPQHAPLKGKIL